jgi:hypothetical protein
MRVGDANNLFFALRVPSTGTSPLTPRPGANIAIDLSTDPAGIVSITPAQLLFNAPDADGRVQIKALAPGSTLLLVTPPPGINGPATPIAFSVTK